MKRKIKNRDREFTMIVERDRESGWLVGEIVELSGCFTEAPDLPSLEAAIQEAIKGFLDELDDEEPQAEYVATMRVKVSS